MANFHRSIVSSGLGTVADLKVPDTGIYFVQGSLTLPRIPAGDLLNSSVVALIKKNGSTVYTGAAGANGLYLELNCTAADELSVVLSSAAGNDNALNAVKSNITIGIRE